MARIITKEMVLEAIELARPTAEAILRTEEAIWGPKVVQGAVSIPGINDLIRFIYSGEKNEPWNPAWGIFENFFDIVTEKMKVVMREKMNSSIIAKLMPWLLKENEFMYAGGAYSDEIGATASGARGWADECISEVIISNIKMLARLEAGRREQKDLMEI